MPGKRVKRAEQVMHYRLQEICAIANARDRFVIELVEHGVLEPQGRNPQEWKFSPEQVRICKRASHLHRDLEINTQGIGLSLQLLEEIERLRKRLALLEASHSRRNY